MPTTLAAFGLLPAIRHTSVDMHAHMDAKTHSAKAVEATDKWGGTLTAPSDEYKSPRLPSPLDGALVLEKIGRR